MGRAHEVRAASMAATAKMKNGESFDLLSELADEPSFGMTKNEMEVLLSPKGFTGRCESQVEAFLKKYGPRYMDADEIEGDISV